MLPRILLVGLLASVLAASGTGCCVDGCGMRRGMLGRQLPGPIDCECGGGGCGMCASPCFGPLQFLRSRAACVGGCGEWYFDEWASDPPDCQDPCDAPCRRGWGGCGVACGDSCGGGCGGGGCGVGGIGGGYGWSSFWGRRYRPGMSYGGQGISYGEGTVVHQGEWIDSGVAPQSAPQAAPQAAPTPAKPTQSALRNAAPRQPYYEPPHQHSHQPSAMSQAPRGFRTAANPNPMSSGRMMR